MPTSARAPRGIAAAFAVALSSLLALGAGDADAQAFPSRPVSLVVPFAPGGAADIVARAVAQRLAPILGQAVVIDNKTGAGGTIGATFVARANADGHTLLVCGPSTHGIGPAIYRKMPYDAEKDFVPVGMIGTSPNVLVVHPKVPAKTLQEFIAWAKASPGRHPYGSTGPGGSPHMAMELLKQQAGIDLLAVQYRGDAPAQQDLAAGHVLAMFGAVASHAQNIRAGTTRAIAVTTLARSPELPDVPTVSEAGLRGFDVGSWLGLCAPAGSPPAAVEALGGALAKVMADPATRKQLAGFGYHSQHLTGRQFAEHMSGEVAKWRKVAQTARISLD